MTPSALIDQEPLTLLIVDDHHLVREGLRMLIESQPAMRVVGMAGNRLEALEQARKTSPGLILLDLDLAGEDALTFIAELREAAGGARVLVVTGATDSQVHRQAVRAGAAGVVLKEDAPEVLLKAIERIQAGEIWLDRSTVGTLLREMTEGNSDGAAVAIRSLTSRERQVIGLIAEGLKNKQIAERLFISETTVTHHLSSIFGKLGVTDRLELVIYAFGHNLAKMPNKYPSS